ncbi:MAG TPA: hypothetical protein VFF11_03305 [Candidatus Binatia bacterium]|nr:hypothetical protein [Candidatus Binatia bacterium]
MNSSQNHQPWVDVAMFEDLEAGRVLQTFLQDKGLEARTYDDKAFRYFLFLRPPRITYRVQVRKNQFEGATDLLLSKAPAMLDKALHCPSCASLRVNYPQMTRQFVLPTVLLHLGIIFRVIEHQCYCENCQEMWTLPKDASLHRKVREVNPFPF